VKKFKEMKQDVENITPDPSNFRNHVLPLARIKKIMKMDEDVKMISVETPLLISKACELFIIELAYRGWVHTIEENRRTLQRNDIAQAISQNDFYDFLLDIVEESCKNKLKYSGNSYSKIPPVPLLGFFDNYDMSNNNPININNNNLNNNIDANGNYIFDRNNNKKIKGRKEDENKNNINKTLNNNIEYNLNQSEFFNNINYINNNPKNTNSNLNQSFNFK
jgi:nuclear transcription factor Y gamma